MIEHVAESVLLLVVGMTCVFSSLMFLAGMIWVLKAVDEAINAHRVRRYEMKVEKKTIDPEHNDVIIAVISAAVTTVLRRPVTVRRLRFLGGAMGGSWTSAGRSTIMSSHTITKN